MVRSQSTAQVHEATERLLQTLAARLNQRQAIPLPITSGDIRGYLAAAMAESVGPGVIVVWWDEVSGLQVNVAGTR